MSSTGLNPLLMIKAVTRDERFTASEARFLCNAVLHADNESRKVRYSIAATAREVGVSNKTGSRAISKAEEFGYFATVNRYRTKTGTVVDAWFKSLPPTGQEDSRVEEATGQEDSPSTQTSIPISLPSTFTSSPSLVSHKEGDEQVLYPCFECGEAPCDCAPVFATCEWHTSYPQGKCAYCDRPKVESTLPASKQQELHERHNAQEGWDEYNDPGLRSPSSTYSRRQP